jgi:hypothetical protein
MPRWWTIPSPRPLRTKWLAGKASKRFFFEKKNQKTFDLLGAVATTMPTPTGPKVFLLLFLQKKKRLLWDRLTGRNGVL